MQKIGYLLSICLLTLSLAGCAFNRNRNPAEDTTAPPPSNSQTAPAEVQIDALDLVLVADGVAATIGGVLLPDGCAAIERIDQTGRGQTVRITLSAHRPADASDCPPEPTPFTQTVPLDLSGLATGDYILYAHGLEKPFSLSAEGGVRVAGAHAQLDRLDVVLLESFPLQAQARLAGRLPDRCTTFTGVTADRDGETLVVRLATQRDLRADCEAAAQPFDETLPLDILGLSAGSYTVTVRSANVLTGHLTLAMDNLSPADASSGSANSDELSLPASCTPATDQLAVYANRDYGYCLRYPVRFQVDQARPTIVTFSGPPIGDAADPVRASLTILVEGPAEGRTAEQLATEISLVAGDRPVKRTPLILGGVPAVALEGLPGQTGSRQVYLVHQDTVLHLVLTPVDPAWPQVRPDVDAIWQSLTSSFGLFSTTDPE